MPLSKARNRERMRGLRLVQPKSNSVQPKTDALRAKIRPLKEKSNSRVQPKLESVQPKSYPTEEDAFDPVLHNLTDSIVDSRCEDLQPKQVRKLVNGTYKMVDKPDVDAEGNEVPDYG